RREARPVSLLHRWRLQPGRQGVCVLSNIPADAPDGFVVGRLRDVLLGRDGEAAKAIDAFVDKVMARWSNGGGDASASVEKELDAVNRRIKQTVAMLADPAFDGLDELKATLANLKKRRDGLQVQLKRRRPRRAPTGRESVGEGLTGSPDGVRLV